MTKFESDEEQLAWRTYAAAALTAYVSMTMAAADMAATVADEMLAEEKKREPQP